jgi:membrane protein DedA with SNARE-associated domain
MRYMSAKRFLFTDGRIWAFLNGALLIASIWVGYGELDPTRVRASNAEAILCILLIVLLPILLLSWVHFSRQQYRRPAWNRSPLYWRDPFQALFLSSRYFLAMFAGGLVRVHESGARGFWLAAAFGSMGLGLLIGEQIVYRMYPDRFRNADSKNRPHSMKAL